MIFNQSFLSPGCLSCGSYLIEESLFCAFCFRKFLLPVINDSEFQLWDQHVFLFEWRKAEDSLLNQLVYRLKASQSPQAIKFYTDLLAEKLSQSLDISGFNAFVPVPGSAPNRHHADLIAERLSQKTGLPKLRLLERDPLAPQQKKLSSFQRKSRNPFRLRAQSPEEITTAEKSLYSKDDRYIFVDDVLTTGQSVKHAEFLLKGSKRNAVATLFYRPTAS